MSNIIKKKKKGKRKSNKSIKEKPITEDIPQIKSPLQILSSINKELDIISNNMKYNKLSESPFLYNNENKTNKTHDSLLLNNNFDFDKDDFEIKELINKANFYLSNNNPKQIIKSYENKICQSNDDHFLHNYYLYNNNQIKKNFKNDSFRIKNVNNIKRENIKNSFLNNFDNRYKVIPKNKFLFYSNNNTKRNNYKAKSEKNFLRNSFDKNINQKIKKLENINKYIYDYKRKPIVYKQIDSIKVNKNIFPKIRKFSDEGKIYKFRKENNRFIRSNNIDERAIEILKNKI